ncbi:MAG: hypothetical protein ACREVH_02365, partial [Gammaproteobacteria bacterium]
MLAATTFSEILHASAADLRERLGKRKPPAQPRKRLGNAAARLGLTKAQLVCGLGFNREAHALGVELSALGYASYDDMAQHRNHVFITDVYSEISLDDVLAIYSNAKDDSDTLSILQYLMLKRLSQIEAAIDAQVQVWVIDRYKREVRHIYLNGIAQAAFVEGRLEQGHPGFRALANELKLIIDSKLL